jgi:hypothetical protein
MAAGAAKKKWSFKIFYFKGNFFGNLLDQSKIPRIVPSKKKNSCKNRPCVLSHLCLKRTPRKPSAPPRGGDHGRGPPPPAPPARGRAAVSDAALAVPRAVLQGKMEVVSLLDFAYTLASIRRTNFDPLPGRRRRRRRQSPRRALCAPSASPSEGGNSKEGSTNSKGINFAVG